MIPLNEYPKEELQHLLRGIQAGLLLVRKSDEYKSLIVWMSHVKEAISDQEFQDKQLPFNEPSK